MAMENTVRAGGSRYRNADCHAASFGTQDRDVIATNRPPGGSIENAERMWRRSASSRRRSTPGLAENGGFISATEGTSPSRWSAMFSAFLRSTETPGKQVFQQTGPGRRKFVEVELVGGGVAQCAPGHDGEYPGTGRGLQHPVAGADHGGLRGGVGERQGCRELLQADLFLGTARVGGLKSRETFEHRQHGGGSPEAGGRLRGASPCRNA